MTSRLLILFNLGHEKYIRQLRCSTAASDTVPSDLAGTHFLEHKDEDRNSAHVCALALLGRGITRASRGINCNKVDELAEDVQEGGYK